MASERDGRAHSRREVLHYLGTAGLSAYLSGLTGCSTLLGSGQKKERTLADYGPFDRSPMGLSKNFFSGDDIERPHHYFRLKAEELNRIRAMITTEPTEKASVVVIGGGVAGLVSAYQLRDYSPIVLEQASRFGGNSKGGSWQGLDFSTGAHYIAEPPAGSPIRKLLTDLKLETVMKRKTAEDQILFSGKRMNSFWDGVTDSEAAAQFEFLKTYFENVLQSTNGYEYPEIPSETGTQRQVVNSLDQQTIREHLNQVSKGRLHDHIHAFIEHYCWTSFGASASEVNAATALNFLAPEFGNLWVAKGGNGAIAERILVELQNFVPKTNLRSEATVIDVRVRDQQVWVTYFDADDNLRSVKCQIAIMACPKFVASRILEDIEPERIAAIKQLDYRALVVGNVLLRKPVKDSFFRLHLLGDGKVDDSDLSQASQADGPTDLASSSFFQDVDSPGILTLFRGLPYSAGAAEIQSEGAWTRFRNEFQETTQKRLLSGLGVKESDIFDIRVSRWGHPLPVPRVGFYSRQTADKLRRPFKGRVFFAEQDTWASPCFESAASEAIHWAAEAKRWIKV